VAYIPSKDALLDTWAQNFSDLITADPPLYGLVAADAVLIAAKADAFTAALTTSTNPATRTKPSVAAKDAAKADMLATVRLYGQQIKTNAGVSNSDKADLGLNIDDVTPTPIPPPATNPLLSIVAATTLAHTMRFADVTTPDKRSKPVGTISLQLYRTIDVASAVDPAAADFIGAFTKQPLETSFVSADVGKIATYWGRWQNRRGEVGPWSPAVSMRIV
jgi:hypothetical protein